MEKETTERNIIFITDIHLWSLGEGKGGKAFFNTVRGYKKANWNIWFITSGGGVPNNFLKKGQLMETSYPSLDRLWLSGNKVISVAARFLKLFLLNRFYYKSAKGILRKRRTDNFVIYAYEVAAVKAAKRLSSEYNLPLVTRFQGTKHANTPDTFLFNLKKAPHLSAMKTYADLTIMTNDGTQGLQTLKRLGNKSSNILFWRNGVNRVPEEVLGKRSYFREKFDFGEKFILLTVSRLVEWKKVKRAINAFSIVQHKFPQAELIIVGDGPDRVNLENLTVKLKVSRKVRFVGAVAQDKVGEYMVAADAFLSFYDLSNVGNPLMEAMMCGKAIITLDVGDTGELIRDNENGVLVSSKELDKIPTKICKVIEDDRFRNKISSGALKTAHSFWDWEKRINSEIAIVENLQHNID